MRRRITVSLVLLTAGSLLVTTLVAAALMIQSYRSQDRHTLTHEATGLASLLQNDDGIKAKQLRRTLTVLRRPLHLEQSTIVAVSDDDKGLRPQVFGSVSTPPSVAEGVILGAAAHPGRATSGVEGKRVYAAVGLDLDYTQHGTPRKLLAVVVLTRRTPLGFGVVLPWLAVCLAVVLLLAGLVSWRLGRRLTRPLDEVGQVTARLAGGDLSARVGVRPDTDAELGALGASVNRLAASLGEAQSGQRQFLLSVSHELRTPLTSIRGFAEALEDGTATDAPTVGAIIGSEARRLDRLVTDLLELARLNTGQFSLRPQPVDVRSAAGEAVAAFGPAATELGLTLTSALAGLESVIVLADPDRLGQVIGNLIENALKYAASTVEVGGAVNDGTARLWVEDDGPGITAGDLPHVFSRLFASRAHPGRKVGTGLGLAIVAELVAAMGAEVRAVSPLGPYGGSRLIVSWPPSPSED